MKFLLSLEDFQQNSFSNEDILYTCGIIYLSLWITQGFFNLLLAMIGGELWNTHRNRDIIARLTVDMIAMAMCSYFGCEGFFQVGGFSSLTTGTAYERVRKDREKRKEERLLLFIIFSRLFSLVVVYL